MSSTDQRPEGQSFSSRELRDALGQFCTGITVITAVKDDEPVGVAGQSFSPPSLGP
ncbi:MAG TPA: monooxygenase, partial [Dietzia sp.]|nr:monooxygenase [Dietzia sp.]